MAVILLLLKRTSLLVSKMTNNYSLGRGIAFGIVGGIIATTFVFLLTRLFPVGSTIATPYSIVGFLHSATGITGQSFTINLVARMIVGLIIGGIFGAVVSRSRLINLSRGATYGIVAGIISWFVLVVLAIVAVDAIRSSPLGPSVVATYVLYALARYFVIGVVMGAIVGYLISRYGAIRPISYKQTVQTPITSAPQV